MAESPPPTTASTWFRKMGSAASHTAHADTPPPVWASRSSLGSPSHLALAPVATMTERARTSSAAPGHSRNGRSEKSTRSTISIRARAPNRSACCLHPLHELGPVIPSGKPG
jgi:hypothetical protein